MRIGIDLGGTKIAGILLDAAGNVVHKERVPTHAEQGYDAIVQRIVGVVHALEKHAAQACQVGIGTPGAVSKRTGMMKNCNTECLNGQPLLQDLEKHLQRRIRMSNDANCFAVSEAHDGAAAGFHVVFGIIMGTGIGGGLAIGGRAHDGANDIAGEWGHTPLRHDGPPCYCGRTGCVEALLSGPALALQYQAAGGTPGANARDATEVAQRAEAGEPLAKQVLDAYLQNFGRALGTLINILDPDAIVLGGGLSNMACLYDAGRSYIMPHVFSDELRTPILRAQHGDDSGVRGAAFL